MMSTMRRAKTLPAMAVLACGLALALGAPRSASAVDYMVNGASPSCSDTDPNAGSEAVPYCTIQAAANAHYGPGVTIRVKPATYSERVNVPGNGAAGPGNEYTFLADGSGVVVTGSPEVFFLTFNRSYVTIQGFTITATGSRGVYVRSGSSNIIVRSNTISGATSYGIHFDGVNNSTIEANAVSNTASLAKGIAIYGGSDNNFIQDNDVYSNGKQGIHVSGNISNTTSLNTFQRNFLYSNGDTGLEFAGFSDSNFSLQNVSWSNGQHGYDHNRATGTIHIGDVAWGNGTNPSLNGNGFNIENSSTGTQIYNSIVGNHTDPEAYNLEVFSDSTTGFVADYNIWWNSSCSARILVAGTTYDDVPFGPYDAHALETDPKFVDPANGNFALQSGSTGIDSADSSVPNWPSTDAVGAARFDDAMTNKGAGTPPYADRGALEFQGAGDQVGNPSFEWDSAGWANYNGTGIARVAGGYGCSYALQMTGTASGLTTFGVNDSPNWVATTPAAGRTYRFSAWVRSASSTGTAKLRVREYYQGVLQGTATHSAGVVLSPTWQQLTVDRLVVTAGSTLDFQVLDFPVANNEVFETDNITIRLLP